MNIQLFYFLHSAAYLFPRLDSFIVFSAIYLIYILFALAVVFMCIHYKITGIKSFVYMIRQRFVTLISIPLSVGIAWVIADVLKHTFHTNRPFIALSNVHSLFPETGYAFPSAHSTAIAALAIAVYYRDKRWGYIFLLSAVLIGLARVVAGVHFPIDIIGGYVIGFVVAFLLKTL